MRKRFFRKAVLAAVIAVPAVFSHPDSRALAQEEGKAIEREKEAAGAEEQEAWNSEEEMENISEDTGEEEDTGSEDATDLENQMDAEGDEGFFTENDLFSEMEEDDMLFSEGEEAVPEENMENLIDLYAAHAGFVQEGLPVRNGNGGFVPVTNGEAVFSSKYTRLGWNSNSAVYPWSQAGSSVLAGQKIQGAVQGPYYLPLDNRAKGKYGFRVTNVGFNKEANTSLDLLMTCTDYLDYTYDNKGAKMTDLMPIFGISDTDDLWLLFADGLPAQEIKIDIVKSGTSTPVPGNYRFRWLDIDLYQRFGIRLQNGSIGHRYATKDSVVNVFQTELFSKNYEVLTAPAAKVEGEVPEHTVVYEVDQSAGFYLAILSPGYGNVSKNPAKAIQNQYEEALTGTCVSVAGLQWDAKGYGPVEYPKLTKKTGNTLAEQGAFNDLVNISDEFYYTLQTEIPEEHPAYYYGYCTITDALPAGVDFAEDAAVKMLPSGENVTSWFQLTAKDDVVSFQATQAALASSAFYGKTYEFQIKARMDASEMTPSYSGNVCSYAVKNKGSITCRHKNGQEGTNWSNEVVSRAKVQRPEPEKPQKWIIDGTAKVKAKEYKGRDFETVYEISQQIPQNTEQWKIAGLHIQDELADCFELKSAKLLVEQNVLASFGTSGGTDGNWKLSVKNQLLKLSSIGSLPESSYGKILRLQLSVRLKKGCGLQPYYAVNQNPDILEAHVYNMASVIFEWHQGTPASVFGNTDKTEVIIKEDTPKGTITVRKKDPSGRNLQGAVFEVKAAADIYSVVGTLLLSSGETVDKVTTDESGTAISKPLYMGKYTVEERTPPKGYVVTSKVCDVELKEGDAQKTAVFQNEETLVCIKKVSKKENVSDPDRCLAGVSFLLWEKTQGADKGKLYTTDANGMIQIKGLVPGTYVFQEKTAPDGYVPDGRSYEFTVDENGLVEQEQGHTITVENGYTKAEFRKTDKATQKTVAGATLRLTDAKGKIVDTWISGTTPHRINRLAAGEYLLTELEAPKGYKKGAPVKCVIQNEEAVQSFEMTDVKLVTIQVDKVIHGKEIVWAHGNPVFTFRLQGTDLDGEKYTYYDTVEFTRENTDTSKDARLSLSFEVPAGVYTVSECRIMRYELEKIDGVSSGKINGKEVQFDLSMNQNGTAVFTNKKTTDRELTDTGFVRNVIIP